MIQNIILISEAPETYQRLMHSLAGERVQAIPVESIAAAVSLISSLEVSTLAIVLDAMSISKGDAGLLVDLRTQYPGLPLLIFLCRHTPEETLNRLQSLRHTWISGRPLSDAASQAAVLQLISVAGQQQAPVLTEVAPPTGGMALLTTRLRQSGSYCAGNATSVHFMTRIFCVGLDSLMFQSCCTVRRVPAKK